MKQDKITPQDISVTKLQSKFGEKLLVKLLIDIIVHIIVLKRTVHQLYIEGPRNRLRLWNTDPSNLTITVTMVRPFGPIRDTAHSTVVATCIEKSLRKPKLKTVP